MKGVIHEASFKGSSCVEGLGFGAALEGPLALLVICYYGHEEDNYIDHILY